MKPIVFHRRYRIKTILPDHTATVEDLTMARKFYATWFVHPEIDQITLLRRMHATRGAAADYGRRFAKRRVRLEMARMATSLAYRPRRWWQRALAALMDWWINKRRPHG